jgi:hypothetical protein
MIEAIVSRYKQPKAGNKQQSEGKKNPWPARQYFVRLLFVSIKLHVGSQLDGD